MRTLLALAAVALVASNATPAAALPVALLVPAPDVPAPEVERRAELDPARLATRGEARIAHGPAEAKVRWTAAPFREAEAPPAEQDAPAIAVRFDLPPDANPAEVLRVALILAVPAGTRATNVTLEVRFDEAYRILPAWHHDGGANGTLRLRLDSLEGEEVAFFHALAPAPDAPLATRFAATVTSAEANAEAARDVVVRAANDPAPGYAPRTALTVAGYAATLTAPGPILA